MTHVNFFTFKTVRQGPREVVDPLLLEVIKKRLDSHWLGMIPTDKQNTAHRLDPVHQAISSDPQAWCPPLNCIWPSPLLPVLCFTWG